MKLKSKKMSLASMALFASLGITGSAVLVSHATAHAEGSDVQCAIGSAQVLGGAGGIIAGAATKNPVGVGLGVLNGIPAISDGSDKINKNCYGPALPKNCAPADAWAKEQYPYTGTVPATCH
jgi:hypothetical protein